VWSSRVQNFPRVPASPRLLSLFPLFPQRSLAGKIEIDPIDFSPQ
jgi:hypothetical protein